MLDIRHPILDCVAHRPWPLPTSPWRVAQTWSELLFAHWLASPATLSALLPHGLRLDLYQGHAYVAIVPFFLRIRARCLPPLPTAAAFPEINVRTYVTDGSRPGVWFFSLDAASRLAVWGARRLYRLPYHEAQIEAGVGADAVAYHARRRRGRAAFRARYGPCGESFAPRPGTLEHFLTERYCLYAADGRGGLYRADVHHPPWQLRPAWADIAENSLAEAAGVTLCGEPLLHYASALPTVAWPLERVAAVEPLAFPAAGHPAAYCPGRA
jgi:uncharacterized protein YqjF (DUF2071 family)